MFTVGDFSGYARVLLGLHWDNGKYNGKYYNGVIQRYWEITWQLLFRLEGLGSRRQVCVGYCPPSVAVGYLFIIWVYIALNRAPHIDCYWVGAVPKVCVSGLGNSRPSELGGVKLPEAEHGLGRRAWW